MALLLVPYNNAMRLGQGFNSYTQEICVDNAVVGLSSPDDSQPIVPPALIPIVSPTSPSSTSTASSTSVTTVPKIDIKTSVIRTPSQIVTFTSKYTNKLSDVANSMNISGSLSIKYGELSGGGSGSYVDSDTFQSSDMNFIVSVKVINQTLNVKDQLGFYPLTAHADATDTDISSAEFTKVYGDSFISGFQEGGSFNAIVSIKSLDKSNRLNIQAAAHVALQVGVGSVDADADAKVQKETLSKDSEVNITVNWSGGGQLKEGGEKWSIDTLMEVASRFPELVAQTPQRTYAILTKYTSLRGYLNWATARKTKPLNYELAQLYTSELMDVYMGYKAIWKDIHNFIEQLESGELRLVKAKDQKDRVRKPKVLKNGIWVNGDVLHPYDPSYEGLDEALQMCRSLMIGLVTEVDALTNQPDLAVDPTRPVAYLRSQIFRTLLPRKFGTEDPEEPPVKTFELDEITTTFINQKWNTSIAQPSFTKNFSTTPITISGFGYIDCGPSPTQAISLTTAPSKSDITVRVEADPRDGGNDTFVKLIVNTVAIPSTETKFQTGEVTLDADSMGKNLPITFDTSSAGPNYKEKPSVIAWLTGWRLAGKPGWSCYVAPLLITKRHFDLGSMIYAGTKLASIDQGNSGEGYLRVRWLSFPTTLDGFECGVFGPMPPVDGNNAHLSPQTLINGEVTFTPKKFAEPPKVWIAVSGFDFNQDAGTDGFMRFDVDTSDITAEKFSWRIKNWEAVLTHLNTLQVSWFAYAPHGKESDWIDPGPILGDLTDNTP